MSFISVESLTTPFRDKFHYVTLILVGAIFAAVRLSGAKVEARPVNQAPGSPKQVAAEANTGLTSKGLPNLSFARSATNVAAPQVESQFNPTAEVQRLLGNTQARAPQPLPEQRTITLPSGASTGQSIEEMMKQGTVRRLTPEEERRELERRKIQEAGSLSDIEKRLGLK